MTVSRLQIEKKKKKEKKKTTSKSWTTLLLFAPLYYCADKSEFGWITEKLLSFKSSLRSSARRHLSEELDKLSSWWFPGWTRVVDTVPQPPCISNCIYICCIHTKLQTHMHTVEHCEISAVRATMIPRHYLHTGPPSCACLPHCPLHCFSVEVVITKANISFSLCRRLPSASPSFLSFYAFISSVLPAFCRNGSTAEGMLGLVAAPVWLPLLWEYLVPNWCAISAQCGTQDSHQSSGSNTHCDTATGKKLCCICSTKHCWCNKLGSERRSLFHGVFHYQQCSYSLAFFLLSHWKYGFIKGDGLLGRIFWNVFFSQPFPKLLSGKRHS